ncbi:Hypothetical_protein [Hexamita inflata]|uniref:Hypothetical_protein n=1 Tax=Hexamita inflata TaxID=28002 RepID=A0AA86QR71_9EUKA|nr:Hypothetical protein HINF_LOCUS52176 [Hexamita inflata]
MELKKFNKRCTTSSEPDRINNAQHYLGTKIVNNLIEKQLFLIDVIFNFHLTNQQETSTVLSYQMVRTALALVSSAWKRMQKQNKRGERFVSRKHSSIIVI